MDTETERFVTPAHDPLRKTRLERFVYPKLILGSTCDAEGVEVHRPSSLAERLHRAYDAGSHFIFHNAPFDINVLTSFSPEFDFLWDAVEANRVHDTAILEMLIQIARGASLFETKALRSPKLADLAKRRAGLTLHKDDAVRLNFEDYPDPLPVPEPFLEYAALDAEATLRVFYSQTREAALYADPSSDSEHRLLDNARDNFGLLTSAIQVKGALAFAWLEQHPVTINLSEVETLRARLRAEATKLEAALVGFGLARVTPRSHKFQLFFNPLRERLAAYALSRGLLPPRSSSGLLSLEYDFWARTLPRLSGALLSNPADARSTEEQASVWMRYCKVRKLLSTYIYPYGSGPQHFPTYHNLGARTGRTSAARPNIQNVPKHRDGLRSLFVPAPGRVLIEADFKAAELVCLAEVYYLRYGGSVLGDSLNSGEDPHIATAKRLVGPGWDALPPDEKKRYRQLAKAINFGLPGGLGAAKFQTYANKGFLPDNAQLTEAAARDLRREALRADPELRRYLSDGLNPQSAVRLACTNLNIPEDEVIDALQAWQDPFADPGQKEARYDLAISRLRKWSLGDKRFDLQAPPGFNPRFDLFRTTTFVPTGRPRGRASYTEARNTPFQGLTADAIKLALWRLKYAWGPNHPWRPVCCVHDSILIEADADAYADSAAILETAMTYGLSTVCPHIRVSVDISPPLTSWGPATTATGIILTSTPNPA